MIQSQNHLFYRHLNPHYETLMHKAGLSHLKKHLSVGRLLHKSSKLKFSMFQLT